MIPASERAKTVHALDRSATVTGTKIYPTEILSSVSSGLIWLGMGFNGGSCEYFNENFGSINWAKFLSDY
jgi:hypothetical protein